MKISNLRIERKGVFSYLAVNVECSFSKETVLWFSVLSDYEDTLTSDVYDAFLVAALYPAMYYNEAIEIEGNVSQKLYKNIINYVQAIILDFAPSFHKVSISVKGYAEAKKRDSLMIGTGFSGGIDSFSTIIDKFEDENDSDWRITTLFFFNVGQNGSIDNEHTKERAENRYNLVRDFAKNKNLPYIMMDSNLFNFYMPQWEYDAGVLCRITGVLVFERALRKYYISSAYTYAEMIDYAYERHTLGTFSDPYIMPLLSPENLDIILDGAQYKRSEKTAMVSKYPPSYKYLNICVNSSDDHVVADNCSVCPKCLRTLLTLETLGCLNKYSQVFNLELYKKHSFKYKCQQRLLYNKDLFAKDNIDLAIRQKNAIPSYFTAWLYMFPIRFTRRTKIGLKKILGKRMVDILKKSIK